MSKLNFFVKKTAGLVFIVTVCLIGVAAPVEAQVSQLWVATYNGPANTFDGVTDMTTDAAGNVYVVGYSDADSNWQNCNYATVKYNWAGQQQWAAIYNGPGNGEDKPIGIAVDGGGNVYVTGWSDGVGTGPDYATLKYNGAGVEQWVARYNGPGNGDDSPQALTLDHNGNVIVTGAGSSAGGSYPYWDQTTIKYNAAGVQQWVAVYAGPWGFNDVALAVAVDSLNNVIITGWSAIETNFYDYNTVKYNSAGAQQWVASYAANPGYYDFDGAYAVAVDPQGNVYVTGRSDGDTSAVESDDLATIKYNPDGVQQWVTRFNSSGDGFDWTFAIAVDWDGNVYVPGSCEGVGTNMDAVLLKYNTSGVQQWAAIYNGAENINDGFYDVAVDADGNVYAPGWRNGLGWTGGGEAIVVKYNDAGVEQWLTSYSAMPNGSDWVNNIDLSEDGNIWVAGKTWNGANNDFLTLKYSQPDVILTLTPLNPPIQIPAGGGNFQFDLLLENTGSVGYVLDLWTTVTLPGGYQYPIYMRENLNLPASASILRPALTQFVPGNALSGTYAYNGFVRNHNTWEVLAEDSFPFEKLAGVDEPNHDLGWALFGWEGEEAPVQTMPSTYALFPASPNPFNPTTAISYKLQASSRVSLRIYDTAGELVSTLVDGWCAAGIHDVTFDGAGLASGVYLARLQAGDFSAVQKLLLLK